MDKDERDLLEVLKFELQFLEKGGYGSSPREPWRFQHFFEDSLACMNYDSKDSPGPCSDCVLMQLVPPEFRDARIPCRHIRLNAEGETLDSLYRYADQHEIEETYGAWLRGMIAKIEAMRATLLGSGSKPSLDGSANRAGESLMHNLHPKCANPACPSAFRWSEGGKLFRFRRSSPESAAKDSSKQSSTAAQDVKHYWLCGQCSLVFTLTYDDSQGVILKLLWAELPEGKQVDQLLAS
jgi:hypothetical protein